MAAQPSTSASSWDVLCNPAFLQGWELPQLPQPGQLWPRTLRVRANGTAFPGHIQPLSARCSGLPSRPASHHQTYLPAVPKPQPPGLGLVLFPQTPSKPCRGVPPGEAPAAGATGICPHMPAAQNALEVLPLSPNVDCFHSLTAVYR